MDKSGLKKKDNSGPKVSVAQGLIFNYWFILSNLVFGFSTLETFDKKLSMK